MLRFNLKPVRQEEVSLLIEMPVKRCIDTSICLDKLQYLYLIHCRFYSILVLCLLHNVIKESPCRPLSETNDTMFLSQTLTPVRQSVGAAPCRSTEDSPQA